MCVCLISKGTVIFNRNNMKNTDNLFSVTIDVKVGQWGSMTAKESLNVIFELLCRRSTFFSILWTVRGTLSKWILDYIKPELSLKAQMNRIKTYREAILWEDDWKRPISFEKLKVKEYNRMITNKINGHNQSNKTYHWKPKKQAKKERRLWNTGMCVRRANIN